MRVTSIFLWLFILFLATSCDQKPVGPYPFSYGVASGDPLPNGVILWTKLNQDSTSNFEVQYEISLTEDFSKIVDQDKTIALADNDYTVKLDIKNLEPDNYYYYRFKNNGHLSVTGRTKTTPIGKTENLRFVVASCSNYQAGYFNAYRNIAKQNEIDAVIHLGDYIYEYGDGTYGDSVLMASGARALNPSHEIINLEDYRKRYALYRKDPDLQLAHQMHPFITIWDDHESANDAYKDGAENHQEEEGTWDVRKQSAKKAYAEWMPIRGNADKIYRTLKFGSMADLILLDTRLEGRDLQIRDVNDPNVMNEERTILGAEQKDWLFNELGRSQAKWKILGNQVMFAEFNVGWTAEFLGNYSAEQIEGFFMDIWDGYPAERNQVINFLSEENIDNVVIVTGDVHCSYAYDIHKKLKNDSLENVAVELVAPGITSSNYDELIGVEMAQKVQYQMNKALPNGYIPNPHMKYADMIQHGYLLLELTDKKAEAQWFYSDNILEKTTKENPSAKLFSLDGENSLNWEE